MATGSNTKTLKGFRPSHFSDDEYDDDNQRIKAANLERYAKRAEKGGAIFPDNKRSMWDDLEMAQEGV